MLICVAVGFLTALIGSLLVLREKIRSWFSGFISGTLAQILGTRLNDLNATTLVRQMSDKPFVSSLLAVAIGVTIGIAVIIAMTLYTNWRKRRGGGAKIALEAVQEG